jgi:predicted transcriptional regulator YdeE
MAMNQKTRIETFGPVEFIGIALFGNPETTSFHNAWDYFGAIADDASISRIGKSIYGLQLYHPMFPQKFELSYMACIEKEPDMDVPIRMLSKIVPKCKYVVQKVDSGVMGIDDALLYLYQDYIPKNGLGVAMPIDFEKYCNVKNHYSVPDEIEIWVPVKNS